jgi:Glu-tRNA(Gln) amidotransferase subunit E-like FAD-binding protein
MYPDTDLPPLAITEERIERIRMQLPEPPWKREERYRALGLAEETAARLSIAPERGLFEKAIEKTSLPPAFIAGLLLGRIRSLRRKVTLSPCSPERFAESLKTAEKEGLSRHAILPYLEEVCGDKGSKPAEAAGRFKTDETTEKDIESYLRAENLPPLADEKLKRYLMGRLRERFPSGWNGKRLSQIVDTFMAAGRTGSKG